MHRGKCISSGQLPVGQYAAADLCLYNERLPENTGRREHPFSGRYGSAAEVMKKHFHVNVPLPEVTNPADPVAVTDGTIELGELVFGGDDDRDMEEEEHCRMVTVAELLQDMLDYVEDQNQNVIAAPDMEMDKEFEF